MKNICLALVSAFAFLALSDGAARNVDPGRRTLIMLFGGTAMEQRDEAVIVLPQFDNRDANQTGFDCAKWDGERVPLTPGLIAGGDANLPVCSALLVKEDVEAVRGLLAAFAKYNLPMPRLVYDQAVIANPGDTLGSAKVVICIGLHSNRLTASLLNREPLTNIVQVTTRSAEVAGRSIRIEGQIRVGQDQGANADRNTDIGLDRDYLGISLTAPQVMVAGEGGTFKVEATDPDQALKLILNSDINHPIDFVNGLASVVPAPDKESEIASVHRVVGKALEPTGLSVTYGVVGSSILATSQQTVTKRLMKLQKSREFTLFATATCALGSHDDHLYRDRRFVIIAGNSAQGTRLIGEHMATPSFLDMLADATDQHSKQVFPADDLPAAAAFCVKFSANGNGRWAYAIADHPAKG